MRTFIDVVAALLSWDGSVMSALLAELFFRLVVGAQFLAVVAAHRLNQDGSASSAGE
jgi:hypothetical protein